MGLLDRRPPLPSAPAFDLDAFMGDWYVQGHIPLGPEADAHNPVESYRRGDGDRIDVAYAFREGSFTGPLKFLKPTGFPTDDDDAEWGMRLVWPFRAEYIVTHVNPDHTETIVGRTKRDHVWIMTKEPMIEDHHYERLVSLATAMGYDADDIRRVPQRWPDEGHPASEGPEGSSMADRYA